MGVRNFTTAYSVLILTLNLIFVALAKTNPCVEYGKERCYLTTSKATCIENRQQIKHLIGATCCCNCTREGDCAINGVHCHKCTDGPDMEEPDVADPVVDEPTVENPEVEEPVTEVPDVEEPTLEIPDAEEPDLDDPTVEKPVVRDPVTAETETGDPDTEKIDEEEIESTKEPVTNPELEETTETARGHSDGLVIFLVIIIAVLAAILVLFCFKPNLILRIKKKCSCKRLSARKSVDEEEALADEDNDVEASEELN